MLNEVKNTAQKLAVKPNFFDRALSYIAPVAGARRMRARAAMALFSSYDGASKSKRSMKGWQTYSLSPDADTLGDLPTLRSRSRDLVRNNPLAGGAIKTKVTNVVGTGLWLQSRIDRDVIQLSDEAAGRLETQIEREWKLFWESKDVDITRTQTGVGLTRMVYQQAKENGDVFILLPHKKRKGSAYDLRLQVIEADRVCNKGNVPDTDTLAGGIQRDQDGAPVAYHILRKHPGAGFSTDEKGWQVRKAFGEKSGLRQVIHLYNPTRPGQSRGVPDLAAVIEPLKQLSRYTEAEIMSAVVAGLFTVFIESDMPGAGASDPSAFKYADDGDETGHKSGDSDLKLGNGLVMELGSGEKINTANPGRPNSNFDDFVVSVLRQVGMGLEIPFEILIKHFTASYSAARAALLEFWSYVLTERRWLSDNFLKIIYEAFFYEAVATGRIKAPGFFADPAVRAAYLSCTIGGPSKKQIDELKEVKAATQRVDAGISTLAYETAELTGQDWEKNHKQQVKEFTARKVFNEEDGNETT